MLAELTPIDRKLREIRAARLLTQGQLSQASGVSVMGIRNLEHGRSERPRPGTIRRLAEALGVEPTDLADDTLTTREVLRRAERGD